jgi:hypothetical protein
MAQHPLRNFFVSAFRRRHGRILADVPQTGSFAIYLAI